MIDMTAVHKAFCKRNKIKYAAKNMVKDLSWQCFAVATVLADLLKAEGKKARAVYGLWHGECVTKPGMPFHRHGWTVVGNEVWDATRFVFEGKKPYLFKAKISEHPEYDEGMRLARNVMSRPYPATTAGQTWKFNWSYPTYMFLCKIMNEAGGEGANPITMTYPQVMWLGNQDYLLLGDHIDEIYKTLIRMDLGVTIPHDYKEWWRANK